MTNENKDLVRRYIEKVWNNGDAGAAVEFLASDLVNHLTDVKSPPTPQEIARGLRAFRAMFPDFNATIEHLIAEGDLVAVHWTGRGTNKGEIKDTKYGDLPPTNKLVTWTGMNIYRLKGRKILEIWANVDALGQASQLGLLRSRRHHVK